MKRILFNRRFVNKTGDDLIPGKIHTIRANFEYWKRFEGQEVALAYWLGKPYRSKQRVFCVKKIVSVEEIIKKSDGSNPFCRFPVQTLAKNDGFANYYELEDWFRGYPNRIKAIIHFTEFRYAK
ncbi:MAG: hypothetical protein LBK68_03075 [Candidatus Margulisbacteria bacterium]|jgi:hypothetical protein|nr:hypothetical protein [Candidatus Margulisiibacteriota bacterium]